MGTSRTTLTHRMCRFDKAVVTMPRDAAEWQKVVMLELWKVPPKTSTTLVCRPMWKGLLGESFMAYGP